jgi:hypothetical protein
MYRLLLLLSISGEFPCGSLGILGNARTIKAMVHKMEAVQKIRVAANETMLSTKLFQVSGKGDKRTVRLAKNALSILNDIHANALGYYLSSFPKNKFTGDRYHIFRNHRVAEAVAMCMMADIQAAPYLLPELQKNSIRHVIPKIPAYYLARNFKKIYESELNKTIFTRIIGLLFYPGGGYAVYNTRNAVMKWSGLGEIKAKQELSEIARMNAGLEEITSVILFGTDANIALQTVVESDKSRKKQVRFDRIFFNIHFVPLNEDGINLLKILTLQNWHEKLMNILFNPKTRPKGYGSIEYDAFWKCKYFYSHIDSDIARLIRFREALLTQEQPFEVLCLPWQVKYLTEYLGDSVILKQLEMPTLLKAMSLS